MDFHSEHTVTVNGNFELYVHILNVVNFSFQ